MLGKFRILVADDDPGIRDLIRTYLEGSNCDVLLARDGSEVSARMAEFDPHALILDINMPKMDGFAVLETIGSRRENRLIAVLVLTARHAADDVRRAIKLGAKDYLTKPFTKPQLLTRVARLLTRPLPAPVDVR